MQSSAGGKHSWICPNGFAFHQVSKIIFIPTTNYSHTTHYSIRVSFGTKCRTPTLTKLHIFLQIHLICVPPSADNICKQSNKYHFVNEYLYQPLNEKEASATNTSLVYADRYYPQGYSVGSDMLPQYAPDLDDLPAARAPPSYRSRPMLHRHVGGPPRHHQSHPSPRPNSSQPPGGDPRKPGPGVFYSPESINIPLSHRRPPPRSPSPRPNNYPRASPKFNDDEYEDY